MKKNKLTKKEMMRVRIVIVFVVSCVSIAIYLGFNNNFKEVPQKILLENMSIFLGCMLIVLIILYGFMELTLYRQKRME